MAIPKTSFHARSISLPSASHPHDASLEDHLRRLRASQAEPSSSSSICLNLCSVKDLYEKMEDLIHLPHNQKALCRGQVEDVLDGSLALLDASSSALDALSQMKESISSLESALRRGSKDEGIIINAYVKSRKNIIKTVSKALANLKKSKNCELTFTEDDSNIVKMLKEAEVVGISALTSVLSYVKGKKGVSQTQVVKSMIAKLVKSNNTENSTQVDEVDRSVSALSQKQSGSDTKAVLIKQLEALEMVIQDLEYTTESVSRCFVKTRVSLLNVLHH